MVTFSRLFFGCENLMKLNDNISEKVRKKLQVGKKQTTKRKVRALANYFKGMVVSISVHVEEGEYIKDMVGFNGWGERFNAIHRNKMCRPKN